MAIKFREDFLSDSSQLKQSNNQKPSNIPDSSNITGIELRLSKALIIDNKTPKVWPFPGFAKIYLLVIVVTDSGVVLQNLDLKSFAKVDDGEEIPVDKTIFYWKQNSMSDVAPSQIHTLVSVIKSKESLREVGKVLSDVKNDEKFSSTLDALKTVLKGAQTFTDVSGLILSVAEVVGKFLGNVDDKPLMTWVQSFSDINGDYDQLGKTAKSRKNNYSEIELSLTIRDTSRELALAQSQGVVVEELVLS
jgi:hypothetical protein